MPSRTETGVTGPALLAQAVLVAILTLASTASAEPETPAGDAAAKEAAAEAPAEPGSDAGVTSDAPTEVAAPEVEPAEADAEPAAEPESGDELEEVYGEDSGEDEEDPSSAEAVEEFLVTSSKIEILVPDTTISVIGFDPDRIKAEGISDIRDLSRFTPSLEIKSAFAASNPTIFIRGVGLDDYNANAASAVAIYQDGVYMASPAGQLFQFFDVERVEVLRGPQPTLFRNAEAGAILVNSAPPTDELDTYVEATYGNRNLWQVEGAVGGPLVPELLMARASGSWEMRDGITKNRCAAPLNGTRSTNLSCNLSAASSPETLKFQHGMLDWTNNLDAYALRGQLLFTPTIAETEMEWLANVHGGKNRSRAFQYQHRGVQVNPISLNVDFSQGDEHNYQDRDNDFFAGDYNLDGPENIDLFGANLRGSWFFGEGYELQTLTAYEWHDRKTVENSDASPKYTLESEYIDKAWQLSEQLDLRGDWESLFDWEIGSGEWTLGAYYLQEDLDVGNFFNTLTNIPQHLGQEYTQKTRNAAAYAYSVYRIQPGCDPIPCDFTFTSGIRFNWEKKTFDTFVCEDAASVGDCGRVALQGKDDATWTAPSGEVSLAWDFKEDSSLYAKYSRGWKGGHFNGGATTVFDIITSVDPETVDSYEGGLRSFWFDGRLMLNTTFFYYDYRDLQVFIIDQTDLGYPIPKLVNATDSVVYGIEVDLGLEPLDGLNLTYNFAWVESEYLDFSVTLVDILRLGCEPRPCRPPRLEVPRKFDYTGSPLIASPRYSMTGTAEYEVPIPGTLFGRSLGTITPRFTFNWKDQIYFDACEGQGTKCNFPKGYFGQKPYWFFNAALTWRSANDRFEVMGWVHNFTNEFYKTQNFDLSEGIGVILDAYAEPRMYGVTATVSF